MPQDKSKLNCSVCFSPMVVKECKFISLPRVLLIKINRTLKDTPVLSNLYVECPETLNLAGFTVPNYTGPTVYDLNSTICVNNGI
jgi:hypothetical protein